jgi:hypothetical protein
MLKQEFAEKGSLAEANDDPRYRSSTFPTLSAGFYQADGGACMGRDDNCI